MDSIPTCVTITHSMGSSCILELQMEITTTRTHRLPTRPSRTVTLRSTPPWTARVTCLPLETNPLWRQHPSEAGGHLQCTCCICVDSHDGLNSDLAPSPSISDNKSNLEIDVLTSLYIVTVLQSYTVGNLRTETVPYFCGDSKLQTYLVWFSLLQKLSFTMFYELL